MADKIRILHYGLSPNLGGIETYLYKITSNIDLNKFEFNFLIEEGKTPCYFDELSKLNCGFYKIPLRRNNPLKNIIGLRKIMKNEKFDIIHCHQNSLSYISPCIEGIRAGSKVIVHSRNADMNNGSISNFLHKYNFKRLKKMDIIRVAVSDLAGNWMFGDNIPFIVLNNGIDTSTYTYSEEARRKIREEFKLYNKEVILNVGAFRIQKNHRYIIEIFREYLKIKKNSILMLVGEGELKREIMEMVNKYGITENVIFTGKRNDIPSLLSAADKFLFPSYYEGFPNALIEAECSGLPCIVSKTITEQSYIRELCTSVFLDAPISEWVNALNNSTSYERDYAPILIKEKELDIDSEINKLSNLYMDVLNKRG